MKTDAQKRATKKYDAKTYNSITFRIKKEDKDILTAAVQAAGISRNAYIKNALNERLIKDGFEPLK